MLALAVSSSSLANTPAKPAAKPTAAKTSAARPKHATKKAPAKPAAASKKPAAKPKPKAQKAATAPRALPKLLDLGSDKCIPCKMMVPVMSQLSKEHKGKLKVEFIDVWKNAAAAKKYKVQGIPTQIFFDANGKEFYRHNGYMPKADILKVFRNHGIKL
jgi:thioredoxin 1